MSYPGANIGLNQCKLDKVNKIKRKRGSAGRGIKISNNSNISFNDILNKFKEYLEPIPKLISYR
jgi:hypothetical protein